MDAGSGGMQQRKHALTMQNNTVLFAYYNFQFGETLQVYGIKLTFYIYILFI